MKFSKKDQSRVDANTAILGLLADYMLYHPRERFGQMLVNLNLVQQKSVDIDNPYTGCSSETYWEDDFYTESSDILKRVHEHLSSQSKE